MAEEVFMDIPEVEKIANSFEEFGEVLETVAKVLEAITRMLQATAFISLGSTAAIAAFLDRIHPRIKALGQKMQELSGDVDSAIRAYRDGDLSGSKRFV